MGKGDGERSEEGRMADEDLKGRMEGTGDRGEWEIDWGFISVLPS